MQTNTIKTMRHCAAGVAARWPGLWTFRIIMALAMVALIAAAAVWGQR